MKKTGVCEANQGVERAWEWGQNAVEEKEVFEMQRGLIPATIGWTDRAQDLLQRVGPASRGQRGRVQPGVPLSLVLGGWWGRPCCEALGGILIPSYLDKRLRDSCFISLNFLLLLVLLRQPTVWGFIFLTMKYTIRNTSFDMGYLAENRWHCLENGREDFAQKLGSSQMLRKQGVDFDEPVKWRQNGQMVWSDSKYI